MIKIVICDDQVIVQEGLSTILSSDPEIEVIGTASDGLEALEIVEKSMPDLVLMDLKMPLMNGIIATRKIREKYPEIYVLVLTTYDDDEWVFDAIRSGASGYLLKDTLPEDLIRAIKGTVDGKSFVDPNVAGKVLSSFANDRKKTGLPSKISLTERERELLVLITQGLTNAEIAKKLFLL